MSLRRNIVANFLGQGWTALMGLAFLPLYIQYLGMEAYGLIGLYAVMQAWLALLDMGMTPTLNWEMARYTAGAHTPRSIADLLRSLEIVCALLALLLGMGVWALSGWLASDWLRAERLPAEEVAQAISIMGWVLAFRLVEGLYRGALLGLQRQVQLNIVAALAATGRWAGAVGVLAWFSPSIEAFFLWQVTVSAASAGLHALLVHRVLAVGDARPRFSMQALSGIRGFAGGMLATTLLALLLTQSDKMLLSRLLNLEEFGRYTFAATVAGALLQLVAPLSQAYFPRFTELVTLGDRDGLAAAYHQAARLASLILLPVSCLLVLFGDVLLSVWTGDAALAGGVTMLLALLAAGTLLNGMMYIPYILQLAHGWSGFAARVNLVAVSILVPAILWVTPRYGAEGAAWVWVALNAGYVLIAMHFMHRRLLPEEKWRWYGRDVALPLLATVALALLLRQLPVQPGVRWLEAGWIALVYGLLLVAAASASIGMGRIRTLLTGRSGNLRDAHYMQ